MVKLVPDYRHLTTADAPTTTSGRTNSRVLKNKRPHTKVACNNCREKKWACDGERPQCLSCRKKNIDCVYTSVDKSETHIGILRREKEVLKRHSESLEELLGLLKGAPFDLAQVALLKLTQDDPLSAIKFLKAAYPKPKSYLSEHTTARGYLPPIRSDQEFELMVRYPVAYPIPGIQASSVSTLQLSRFNSLPGSASPPPPANIQATKDDHIQHGPWPVPQLVDPRLHGLDITFWTSVEGANKLATGAISFFLETTHPILGLFDVDLFIGSLKSHSTKICSSFCVNSLLAFTCQGYAAKDASALLKSYEFEREADRLFKSENECSDSLPSMVGMTLLWLSHLCHGSGTDGIPCVKKGFQMAKRLRLYGVPNRLTATDLGSTTNASATMHTAWGCFMASTVQSIYTTPVFTNYPPLFPIPGDTETEEDSTAPKDAEPLKVRFSGSGDTYVSFCKFFKLVQGILVKHRGTEGSSDMSLEFTLSEFHKILVLSNQLPKTMTCLPDSPYHVFVFHVWFHTVTLEIFRPFITDEDEQLQSSMDLQQNTPSPPAIFTASIKQLKQVILACARYPETSWDMFWQVSMMSVATAIIKERDPEWRLYFFLCLHHFKILARCFNLVAWIIPGLLAMGIQSGAISRSEAHFIKEECEKDQNAHMPEGSGAGFILDMDRAIKDWDAAQADALAAEFEEIDLFDEFTTGII